MFFYILGVIFEWFWVSAGIVKTELSLERELDPEGLGRSENRWFFDVFSESKKKGIQEHPFLTCCDFMNPEGADWAPKWFPHGKELTFHSRE